MLSFRWSTSFCRALFCSHAVFARSTELRNKSPALARRRMVSELRMFLMPSFSSVTFMSSPESLVRFKPSTNASMASIGRFFQASANWPALMPATRAYSPTTLEPLATFLEISWMMRVIAEPPASALMPSEDIAPDMPKISACENLAAVPAPARRRAIAEISFSVVARWLPRSTMVEP